MDTARRPALALAAALLALGGASVSAVPALADAGPAPAGGVGPAATAGPAAAASPAGAPVPSAADLPPLAPPTGLVPAVDDGSVRKQVVLSWGSVAGATGYRVQVDPDAEFSDTPTLSQDVVGTRVVLPVWLPHGRYAWRVAALVAGHVGRWSAAGGFTRGWQDSPTPLTPAPATAYTVLGAFDTRAVPGPACGPVSLQADCQALPQFSWTPVAAASAYEVQVSSDPAFSHVYLPTTAPVVDNGGTQDQSRSPVDTCFTTHTSVTFSTGTLKTPGEDDAGACVSTLLGDGRPLWWRVRALDRFVDARQLVDTSPATVNGISHLPPTTTPGSADAASACPAAPGASPSVSPSASPSPTGSPVPSGAPSGSPAPSPLPSPLPSRSPAAGASPAPAGPAAGGCDPAHAAELSEWSAATTFSVAALRGPTDTTDRWRTLPYVTTHPLPAGTCSAGVCADVPTLGWDKVPGADSYRVYVALDPDYTNIVRVVDTYGLTWTPEDDWRDSTAGHPYYYVVQACTSGGCGAVTDAPPSFAKRSPQVIADVPQGSRTLADGRAGVLAPDVVLSWGSLQDALAHVTGAPATEGAYAYRVQVARASDPEFAAPLVSSVLDATSFDAVAAAADGDYVWRVQPLDGSGHALRWSAGPAFRHDRTPPSATVAQRSLSGRGPLRVMFSEPVTGAQVALSPATAVRVVTAADGLSATVTPVRAWLLGAAYSLSVTAGVDAVGNPLVPLRALLAVPSRADDRSAALTFAGVWHERTATDAVDGGFAAARPTPRSPASLTVWTSGRGVRVLGCRGPAGGLAALYVDGVRRAVLDTWRSWSGCGTGLGTWTGAPGVHQVQLRALGAAGPASSGTEVDVDAVDSLR